MPGRKGRSGGGNRKPVHMHVVDGSYRDDRHDPTAPIVQPRTEASCPGWLPKAAREFWAEIGPELTRLQLLTGMDQAAFTTLALLVAELRWACAQRKRYTKGPNGERLHPVVGYRLQLIEKLRMWLVEFGMTPASRARIEAIALGSSGDDDDTERPTGTDGTTKVTDRLGRPI